MTVYNTRFSPTPIGPPHLGHLYIALVNETEAHNSGGKFIVRFDDDQLIWEERQGKQQTSDYVKGMTDDLSPYLHVDKWSSQEKDYPKMTHRDYLINYEFFVPKRTVRYPTPEWNPAAGTPTYDPDIPDCAFDSTICPYPYSPILTASKVWFDIQDGVNWLIRGADLIDEFSLYAYYREMMGEVSIRQTYIDRLMIHKDGKFSQISKTIGNCDLKTATKEWGIDGVMTSLRYACLEDPNGQFEIKNIKKHPALIML